MATQRVQVPISFSYPQNVFVSSSSSSFVSESATLLLPASGVTITIIDRNTGSPTTVFAASTGASTLSPVISDAAGNVPGFVVEGSYTVQAAASGSFSGASVNWEAVRGDGVENIFPGSVTTSSLSSGAITLPTLATPVVQSLLPSGVILDFGGGAAPSGFVLCDGSVYAQVNPTFTNLFGAIGSSWNTGGEGTGNFRVPDLRGRVAMGAGTGSGLSARTLAALGGEESHLLTNSQIPAHTHDYSGSTSTELSAHAHNFAQAASSQPGGFAEFDAGGTGASGSTGVARLFFGTGVTTTENAAHAHTYIGVTDNGTVGGTTHNNLQPFSVTTKIIKL